MERHPRGPGGIVLLHDIQPNSVDAFPLLVEDVRHRNCRLRRDPEEELWIVAPDLRPFLLYDELPEDLVRELQTEERQRAAEYCAELEPEAGSDGADASS